MQSFQPDPADLAVLHAVRKSGTLNGKKSIQKLLYFMKEGGIDLKFKFQWYRFGPYSDDFAYYLDDLVAEGLIEAQVSPVSLPGEDFGGVQYNFKLAPKGEAFLSQASLASPEAKKIDRVIDLVREVGPKNLELYASVHYLVKYSSTQSERALYPKGLPEMVDSYKPGRFRYQEIMNAYYNLKTRGWL